MYNAGKEERPLVTEYAFINNITGITSQVQKLLTEQESASSPSRIIPFPEHGKFVRFCTNLKPTFTHHT